MHPQPTGLLHLIVFEIGKPASTPVVLFWRSTTYRRKKAPFAI
jgi:hypothetical protein